MPTGSPAVLCQPCSQFDSAFDRWINLIVIVYSMASSPALDRPASAVGNWKIRTSRWLSDWQQHALAAATIIRGGVLDTHRSTFTAWRRPIGQEKRPSGNYWTNSRSDLANPRLRSCRDVSAFPLHGASVECAKKRGRGVGDGFEGRCTSLVRRSGGRLRHIGSGPNQRTSSISICSAI